MTYFGRFATPLACLFVRAWRVIVSPSVFRNTGKRGMDTSIATTYPQLEKFTSGLANVGIMGLGYVGLPLALASCRAGFNTTGFDIDPDKADLLDAGRSPFKHIGDAKIAEAKQTNRFNATTDFSRLAQMDAIIICVPTPLGHHREPDLSFVESTTQTIATYLQPGQLVVLESTTYPGTTQKVVKPILEASGQRSGIDFFLAYSPEREDPGNLDFETSLIPKLVSGDGEIALALADALYKPIVVRTVRVCSTDTAEAVKLTENIFRAVNIALVNELKIIFSAMGIDIFDVIDAASTKPFGYMPFYPGPGLGGHCIPVDPFYLTWKAREYSISTRFIELAGEINASMPHYVVERLREELDKRFSKGLRNSRILLIGIAYKKNVDDMRESPALTIIEQLDKLGAKVDYFDPYFPTIPPTRDYPALAGKACIPFEPHILARYDGAVIVTDHDSIDYKTLLSFSKLILDTRNRISNSENPVILAKA
jgi:UDP-N-acetyl-D-glucosamine dehydrogenase